MTPETTKKTKKKITLGAYHKSRFRTWITILIAEIFITATEYAKVENKTWASIVLITFTVLAVIFAGKWLANVLCKDVDKEDELAKENMRKAHEAISLIMITILVVVVLATMFWKGSFTITIDHSSLMDIWMLIYSMYLSLESGLFLLFEGKDDEAEEE